MSLSQYRLAPDCRIDPRRVKLAAAVGLDAICRISLHAVEGSDLERTADIEICDLCSGPSPLDARHAGVAAWRARDAW
jgi:hypothetical protein